MYTTLRPQLCYLGSVSQRLRSCWYGGLPGPYPRLHTYLTQYNRGHTVLMHHAVAIVRARLYYS